MHLPDGILSRHAEAVAAVAAVGGIGVAARVARHELAQVPAGRIAAVGALVFAAQMVNVPVASGTSGHLIGAALAVALLGRGLGILTAAAVLVTQALVFADGGVSSLGVNVVNMAIVPGLIAAAVLGWVGSRVPEGDPVEVVSTSRLAAAAGLSTLGAAAAFSAQYAVAALGGDAASTVVAQVLAVHVPIGIAEIVLTIGAVALVRAVDARPLPVVAGALAVSFVVAPWASSSPDGLERVAIDRGFASLAGAHPLEGSPLADYAVSGVDHSVLTVGLAGVLGVAMVLAVLHAIDHLARVRVER
ncbi:MAG: energy-coupling factor ABC transporter permease [Acidimicrobiia bacterium]|nr:energy-coupling factor ABC transporter permease [Acidimicrobiia bacterium]